MRVHALPRTPQHGRHTPRSSSQHAFPANLSSLVTGSSSHKKITQDVSRILWLYYNNKVTLFTFCFCNELFFVALYLAAFIDTPISKGFWLTWPQLLALVNFPIMFGKQIINCVQFWKASKIVSSVTSISGEMVISWSCGRPCRASA